jgi:hypothetical protein
VNHREQWKALQSRLTAARAFADAGDRQGALAEIDAALAIDPQFLAALSLRERIETAPYAPPPARTHIASVQHDLLARRDVVVQPNLLNQPDVGAQPEVVVPPAVVVPPDVVVQRDVVAECDVVVEPDVVVKHDFVVSPDVVAPVVQADGVAPVVRPDFITPVVQPDTVPQRDSVVHADVMAPLSPDAARPLVSAEGYARFEARAKRRRVDRRMDAARAAIDRGRLKDAASILVEIAELDPNLPELAALTAELKERKRLTARSHHGPAFAAAAVFAAVVFAASWLQESGSLVSHPITPAVAVVTIPTLPEPVGTTGVDDAIVDATVIADASVDVPAPEPPRGSPSAPNRAVDAERRLASVTPADAPPPVTRTPAVLTQQPDTAVASAPAPPPSPASDVRRAVIGAAEPDAVPLDSAHPVAPPVVSATSARATAALDAPVNAPVPASVAPAPIVNARREDDELLVKEALQRYRNAYEGLDARSAHAVWPAVNQAALARAFDGLQSQSLMFEHCDVQLRGEMANATCRGSARYVPKIGSREPRTEPRVWNFALRKNGVDWTIESARADR